MKAPATLDEFYLTFPTERCCWEALRRVRWPGGFRCARCEGHKGAPAASPRPVAVRRLPRYQASLTAGTLFQGTRVPLRTWFLAIFFVAPHEQGISALHRRLPTWLERPRRGQDRGRDRGGAAGEDRALHAAHQDSPRHEGRAELVRAELDPPREHPVFTDAWGFYKALAKLGIDHRPHKGGHGRQALDILPWAYTVFGNLKTWLRGTFHGVSPKHHQGGFECPRTPAS